MYRISYKDLKGEFKVGFSEPWGDCLHWWFCIADEMYFNRPHLAIPAEWKFRPSPLGPSNEPDDIVTECVEHATDEALVKFGALMTRYAQAIKHAGRDY